MSSKVVVVDANNIILGRLASFAAKSALRGQQVIIVNAEKAVISGKKSSIVEEAQRRLGTRTLASQKKAPIHPRTPENYVRRVVRGMLPWRKPSGRRAFRLVKVFTGVPSEYSKTDLVKPAGAEATKLKSKYVAVGELAREIGGFE